MLSLDVDLLCNAMIRPSHWSYSAEANDFIWCYSKGKNIRNVALITHKLFIEDALLESIFIFFCVFLQLEFIFNLWKSLFKYEISLRHVPTIVHLINMILKGNILFLVYFQTKASYDFSLQSFDSYSDYMDYTMNERTEKTSVSFGFGFPGLFEFSFHKDDAKYTKSVQKLRRYSGKVRNHFCFLFFFSSSDRHATYWVATKQSKQMYANPQFN